MPRESSDSDLKLIQRAKADDKDAFSILFERHRESVYQVAYKILRRVEDAEDATVETFKRAWISLADFKGDSQPRTWIYRIAQNLCLDILRKWRRKPEAPLDEDTKHAPLSPSPESEVIERVFAKRLVRHIRRMMTKEEWQLIRMFHVKNLDYAAIAEVLGVSQDVVKHRLTAARIKFTRCHFKLTSIKPVTTRLPATHKDY